MDKQEEWLREIESQIIMQRYGITGYSSSTDLDDQNNDKPNKTENWL